MDPTLDDEALVDLFHAYALDHDNKTVFRGRLGHELRIMRCADCGTWHEPPRPICPACWSKHVVATPVTGRGTIFMAIFLHQGPPAPGVDYSTPYPVVTVELEEQAGLRFTSTVVGAANDAIVIGAPVTLDWLDREGVPVPVFRLAQRPLLMISSRNPAKDRVAFANAATTGFSRDGGEVSPASLALDACVRVLRDTGLTAADVDGIVGSTPPAAVMQSALGIPEITWFANPQIPFVNQVVAAVGAVYSGQCDVVLGYHALFRGPMFSRSAARDPFRRRSGFGAGFVPPPPETIAGAVGYTAWASRYLHEFGVGREGFGRVAINARSNAMHNPAAAMRDPLTMDDYLHPRMIRWPLCLLDMDVPVDGADAFVITTTERARDLPHRPVLVHAATLGQIGKNEEDQTPSLRQHGQQVVVDTLKAKSDFWIDDCDVYFPYDGFTIITLNWFENAGFCGPGEAGAFLAEHWDDASNRILIDGRVPVNPHGGALSEGGTQGSGHIREAVHQLQGRAGERQVDGAERAIVTAGGFFFNAQGCTLRVE